MYTNTSGNSTLVYFTHGLFDISRGSFRLLERTKTRGMPAVREEDEALESAGGASDRHHRSPPPPPPLRPPPLRPPPPPSAPPPTRNHAPDSGLSEQRRASTLDASNIRGKGKGIDRGIGRGRGRGRGSSTSSNSSSSSIYDSDYDDNFSSTGDGGSSRDGNIRRPLSKRELLDARDRRRERKREKLLQRIRETEDDNSMDIALVVMLCAMLIFVLLLGVYAINSYDESEQRGHYSNNRNGRHRRSRRRQANPTVVDLSFSLKQLYTGASRQFKVQRQVVCPSLRTGDGPSRAHCQQTAGLCRGYEVKMQAQRDFFSGRIDRTFYCQYMARVEAQVLPGMQHGDTVTIEGAGNVQPGMDPGNVVVQIVELSNRAFKREGDDLQYQVSLTLKEALLGWSREIEHLDGRTVAISSGSRGASESNKTTAIDEVVVLSGEGMPRSGSSSSSWFSSTGPERGDLRAIISVKFPRLKKLPRELRNEVERLF